MENPYRALANQMYNIFNMNVSDKAQNQMLEIIFKDSSLSVPAPVLTGSSEETIRKQGKTIKAYCTDHAKLVYENTQLKETNKELTALLDTATKPGSPELIEIDKAAAENFHPDTGEPLADDEIPFLKCRSPLLRKVGCALQKKEVWQIRRYIQSGRRPAWIALKMHIGNSTISGIKHNHSYSSVPLEHPKEYKPKKPLNVHVGAPMEENRKKNTGKQKRMFGE
ncbi:MAG: hypothetical protein DRQ89_13020 [Epsilonproteobacteria bacterium]|nr:MAG: hypothetical protein DRQ89_13020 [Campylobacterota bacterium]